MTTKTVQPRQGRSPNIIPPISAQHLKRPKVLVIDNDETNFETIKINLQNAGYKVIEHTKSLGMMITIMDERPDLILLDIKMPLLDGPMLCQLIKKNRQISNTPILLYSFLNERQLDKKVAECEAQGYIHKSWEMKRVIRKVSKYLNDPL